MFSLRVRGIEESNLSSSRISERISELIVDVPTPQVLEEIAEAFSAPHERVQQRTVEHVETVKNIPQERISERICAQFVDGPVSHSQPQMLEEVVEVVRAVKKVPQERMSEKIDEEIDDDIVPVDKRGDQACRSHATTGPSYSDFVEDYGSPAGADRRDRYGDWSFSMDEEGNMSFRPCSEFRSAGRRPRHKSGAGGEALVSLGVVLRSEHSTEVPTIY